MRGCFKRPLFCSLSVSHFFSFVSGAGKEQEAKETGKRQGGYGKSIPKDAFPFRLLHSSRYIFNPRFRSCRMSEKENFPVSLSNFTDLSFCTPSGVSIRFTFSGFPL